MSVNKFDKSTQKDSTETVNETDDFFYEKAKEYYIFELNEKGIIKEINLKIAYPFKKNNIQK